MNVEKIQQKANNFAHNYFDMHDNHFNGLSTGYIRGYEEGAMDFVNWLTKHPLDFQFADKNQLIGLDMKYYSSEELYKTFKNE